MLLLRRGAAVVARRAIAPTPRAVGPTPRAFARRLADDAAPPASGQSGLEARLQRSGTAGRRSGALARASAKSATPGATRRDDAAGREAGSRHRRVAASRPIRRLDRGADVSRRRGRSGGWIAAPTRRDDGAGREIAAPTRRGDAASREAGSRRRGDAAVREAGSGRRRVAPTRPVGKLDLADASRGRSNGPPDRPPPPGAQAYRLLDPSFDVSGVSEPVRRVLSLENASAADATRARANAVAEAFRTHDADCGSTRVQVARLTVEIDALKAHVAEHPKDFHSKRGYQGKISKRARLLKYLRRENPEDFAATLSALGLKAPRDGKRRRRAAERRILEE